MLQHLLPERQKDLSPESVCYRAETNQKLEDGILGSGEGQEEALEVSVPSVCGLSLRTGEDPDRQVLQLQVMAAPLFILSPLQEFLYKTAGGLIHWIGLTKAGSEGAWKWVDDTPFDKVLSRR